MYRGPKSPFTVNDSRKKPTVVTISTPVVVCPTGEECVCPGACKPAGICQRAEYWTPEETVSSNPGRDYLRLFAVVLVIVSLIGLFAKYGAPLLADILLRLGV